MPKVFLMPLIMFSCLIGMKHPALLGGLVLKYGNMALI